MAAEIYPYYHPTTTVFVDDDKVFLNVVVAALDLQNCVVFDNVEAALNAINQVPKDVFLNCRQVFDETDFSIPKDCTVWNLSVIVLQALNAKRSNEVSVAVVDYEMPTMNGLEVCQSIERHLVKKIMLTGYWDKNAGNNALSVNKINSYVQKSDENFIPQLAHYIAFNQQQYFANIKQKFMDAKVKLPAFMNDPEFAQYFMSLCEKHGIVEYYLIQMPDGMLMLGADRQDYYQLLIYTEEQLKSQWEVASEQGASEDFLARLLSQEAVPDFYADTQGYYSPIYETMPDLYMFKAEPVFTQQAHYFCHLRYRSPSYRAFFKT